MCPLPLIDQGVGLGRWCGVVAVRALECMIGVSLASAQEKYPSVTEKSGTSVAGVCGRLNGRVVIRCCRIRSDARSWGGSGTSMC